MKKGPEGSRKTRARAAKEPRLDPNESPRVEEILPKDPKTAEVNAGISAVQTETKEVARVAVTDAGAAMVSPPAEQLNRETASETIPILDLANMLLRMEDMLTKLTEVIPEGRKNAVRFKKNISPNTQSIKQNLTRLADTSKLLGEHPELSEDQKAVAQMTWARIPDETKEKILEKSCKLRTMSAEFLQALSGSNLEIFGEIRPTTNIAEGPHIFMLNIPRLENLVAFLELLDESHKEILPLLNAVSEAQKSDYFREIADRLSKGPKTSVPLVEQAYCEELRLQILKELARIAEIEDRTKQSSELYTLRELIELACFSNFTSIKNSMASQLNFFREFKNELASTYPEDLEGKRFSSINSIDSDEIGEIALMLEAFSRSIQSVVTLERLLALLAGKQN